jgi:hypothetical protein
MRHVCRFSCGAASALATKLTLQENDPKDVLIINAFIKEEHEDNRRFLKDCEEWFGHPILVLRDEKYGASTDEVWRRKRFMKGMNGAPCSLEIKRKILNSVKQEGDLVILGLTCDEQDRFDRLCDHFPEEASSFRVPLIERGINKEHCLSVIKKIGLELPLMYRLGYDNANCIGCVKGGQAYWQNIRADFPERFEEIKKIQESIGPGAGFLAFRSGPRKKQRMMLSELPEGRGNMKQEPGFECGPFCEVLADDLINIRLMDKE